MLPLLNLTNFNLIAPDTLQGTGSLVPEGSDALRGGFAGILQSTVQPALLLPATAGEGLPTVGKLLPVTLSGVEPQLDTDIELPLAEVDLLPPGPGQPETVDEARAELPVPALLPGKDSAKAADDGLPATVHVPPGSPVTGTIESDVPISAGETAGDGLADALQVPLVPPHANAPDRGSRLQERDRAVDSATLQQRSVAANERTVVHRHAAVVPERESAVAARAATAIDPPLVQAAERGPRTAESPALNRAPAEPRISVDDSQRAVRDDGLPILRAVQAAAWQQGTVVPDVPADSSPRMQVDVSAALPRTVAATPSQAVPQLPPAAQSIDVPVQQSGWDSALADRVTMMANGKLQHAELRLSPAELGPLRIQLEIDDGVANVSFQSQHPLTRDALEQAMPRLRELLAENGLSLGQADVGDDSNNQKSREALADVRSSAAAAGEDGGLDEPAAASVARRVADGLVDTFA